MTQRGFVGQESEQLVPDQRAADIGRVSRIPRLVVLAARIDRADISRLVINIVGIRQSRWMQHGIRIRFDQRLRRVDDLSAEMELVAATLADLADHAAVGTTVLGAVTASVGFLLLDRTVGQLETADIGHRIAAEIAVDVIGVFRDAGATERHLIAKIGAVATDCARRQQGNRLCRTRDRQALQLRRSNNGAGIDLGHVDRGRAMRRDRDCAQGVARTARGSDKGDIGTGARCDDNVTSIGARSDGIGTYRQRTHRVASLRICSDGAGEAGFVLDRNCRARRHVAVDGTAGGLGVNGACKAETQRDGQGTTLEAGPD